MKLFTEDDFINLKYYGTTRPSAAYAEYANNKLNEFLQSATVVYCDKDELHFSGVDEIGYTHKGYLIGVEEIKIEPCKHEPEITMCDANTPSYYLPKCKHCGCELIADWKVK